MGLETGRIAAMAPSDINEHELYSCPAGTRIRGFVSVCNKTSATRKFGMAHCAAGHGDNPAGAADWRVYECEIDGNSPPHEINIELGPTETIRIISDQADALGFIFEGMTRTEEGE